MKTKRNSLIKIKDQDKLIKEEFEKYKEIENNMPHDVNTIHSAMIDVFFEKLKAIKIDYSKEEWMIAYYCNVIVNVCSNLTSKIVLSLNNDYVSPGLFDRIIEKIEEQTRSAIKLNTHKEKQ